MKKNKKEAKEEKPTKEYAITNAVIKDDFCNYGFDVLDGIGIGDTHNVKGRGMVLDDLKDSFQKLNVHLAAIDDVFKHSNIEVKNIGSMQNHELAGLYRCNGFKIKGSEDNKTVVLTGTKFVSVGGQIAMESPKILLDKFSSYTWHNELSEALDAAIIEVEMYKEGKYVPVVEDDFVDPKQHSMVDEEAFYYAKV